VVVLLAVAVGLLLAGLALLVLFVLVRELAIPLAALFIEDSMLAIFFSSLLLKYFYSFFVA
jgi:hypothetical protein